MSKKKTQPIKKAKKKTPTKKVVVEKKQNLVSQKNKKSQEIKKEVDSPVLKKSPIGGRNGAKYLFNGKTYGKGRLVLAVVTAYVKKHPKVTYNELLKVFPKELQKYYSVFVPLAEAKRKSEYYPRYFIKEAEQIKLEDGTLIAVSTQWGADNIKPFITTAIKLGITIKETI